MHLRFSLLVFVFAVSRLVSASVFELPASSHAFRFEHRDGNRMLEVFYETVLEVTQDGVPTYVLMSEALHDQSLNEEHMTNLNDTVHHLSLAWNSLRRLTSKAFDRRQNMEEAHDRLGTKPQASWQTALTVGLCVLALLEIWGRRIFNLFSTQIYSRSEVALTLCIACIVTYSMLGVFSDERISSNPFVLYALQLILSFIVVLVTLPVLVGTHRSAPWWVIWASVVVLIFFMCLAMVTPVSFIDFLTDPDLRKAGALDLQGILVLIFMFALVVLKSLRICHKCGIRWRITKPFYEIYDHDCADYVSRLFRNSVHDHIAPAYMPSALILALVGAVYFCVVVVAHLASSFWYRRSYWSDMAVRYLVPWNDIFTWAGHPLPLDNWRHLMTRISVSLFLSLALASCYIIWLLHTVRSGYKRIFRSLMRHGDHPGKSVVESFGLGAFHAKWATYFAGAFVGNCILALIILVFLFFWIFLLFSFEQFWLALFSLWRWCAFYALLYATRYCIFRWTIPRYVLQDDGSLIRRRVWALVFPTLTILNLVLGFTSGFLRFLVMWPYFLINFFRVDMTFLPDHLCEWDWSLHPFISLVLHSHTFLNPIMNAVATHLGETHCQPRAPLEPLTFNSLLRDIRVSFSGQRAAEASPDSGGVADAEGHPPQPEPASVLLESPFTVHSPPSFEELKQVRARNRWKLAVLLARNPSLRAWRSSALAQARSVSVEALDMPTETSMRLMSDS